MTEPISLTQFRESDGVGDWRILSEGACAFFRTGSLRAAARFVTSVGDLPGIDDHPPSIDVRHDGVTVRLITIRGDFFGMSRRDVELAREISGLAREQGLTADPSAVQGLLVIPGAPRDVDIFPFWRAVLGYDPRADSPEEDLVDPHRIGAPFWFETMHEARPDGGGAIHIAVWVPHEEAEARVAAALAAGGRLVRDDHAPSWWTLADPAGNEADIATSMNRD